MESYGNPKETIGFLWIPMEIVREPTESYTFLWDSWGNHWIPMVYYGNPKQIIEFLQISMEMVRNPLDSYRFLWNCCGNQ